MSTMTKRDAVDAAMSLAEDVAEGRLAPADLESQAVAEMRSIVGEVAGPDDPLWPTQVDIARQAVGLGALSADELREWATVLDRQNGIEPVGALALEVTTPESGPTASDDLRGADEAADATTEPEAAPPVLTVVEPAPAPSASVDGQSYNPLRGWSTGRRSPDLSAPQKGKIET